jgi:CBS domain-containing protein
MSVELDEVRRFLSAHEPFSHLPDEELDSLPGKMEIIYVRRGETVITAGQPNDTLYVIRSGAVDVLDSQDVLLDRRGAGRFFGHSTIVTKGGFGAEPGPSRYTMIAVEDSLLLTMERDEVRGLIERNPEVARYFAGVSERIRAAAERLSVRSGSDALRTRVAELVDRDPVSVGCEATVQDAAKLMSRNGISCLPVISDTADTADAADAVGTADAAGLPPVSGNELVGIITDRDLRTRVIAEGLSTGIPVSDIMTRDPFSTTADTTAFEAMLMMSEQGVHHLPVVGGLDGGGDGVTGVISASDIMRALRNDPIYLTADLAKATDTEQMRSIFNDTAEMTSGFIGRGASAEEVSEILTVGLDSLARRLLVLAEEELGPPPVPYAFIVIGSQARRAVGFSSDQDNGLVLHNSYDEDRARRVLRRTRTDGLHRPRGGGTAAVPGRHDGDEPGLADDGRPVEGLLPHLGHRPEPGCTAARPDLLRHASDLRGPRTRRPGPPLLGGAGPQFLAVPRPPGRPGGPQGDTSRHLPRPRRPAGRGLPQHPRRQGRRHRPDRPDRTVVRVDGRCQGGGYAPAARPGRSPPGVLTQKAARDLTEAFNFLKALSLRHQAGQFRSGEEANYRIDPDSLGKLDRENLRDAFGIIKGIQTSLAVKYPVRNT